MIVTPANGDAVSGTITLSARADGGALASAQWQMDNGAYSPMMFNAATSRWEVSVNTAGWAAGMHVLRVSSMDMNGLTGDTYVVVSKAAAPAPAIDFPALAVFNQVSLAIPATISLAVLPDNTPVAASLPAGAIAEFTLTGMTGFPLGNIGTDWKVAGKNLYGSFSTITTGAPVLTDAVKVVAWRTLAPGTLVIITIDKLAGAPPDSVEIAYLFNGTMQDLTPTAVKVGGLWFGIDQPGFPTSMAPGLAVGNTVTVRFAAGL